MGPKIKLYYRNTPMLAPASSAVVSLYPQRFLAFLALAF
jgi:hypothetical protein